MGPYHWRCPILKGLDGLKLKSGSHMAKLTSCRVSTIGDSMKKYTKRVRVGIAIVMNASESALGPMDDGKN